jgi:pectate lyase
MKAIFKKSSKSIWACLLAVVMAVSIIVPVSVKSAKADVVKPEKIEATGWLESAYVEWSTDYKADSYNAYVKEKDGEYVKLDDELIRHYKTDKDYYRADALGLKEGTYIMKVVPVKDGKEVASKALETEEIAVASHDRSGFAFSSDSKYKTGSGAYNDDGTLKQDAVVLYVTKDTAKTVTMTVKTDTNKTTKCDGIQNIIDALQKGKETRPVDIRIIGTVTKNDLDKISSSSEGLQVKGKSAYSDMKLTIEGVGSDACIKDFGILVRNAANVEIRNLSVLNFMDDGISIDTSNCNIWVHNLDIYYGQAGSDSDQKKGDGSIDVKKSQYCTIAYNHFFDSGKCGLVDATPADSGYSDYLTYHHNWFDHSDSRHPRIRNGHNIHVYNNYYDGNSKYGVGVTSGSSAFVEANVFENCKYPMMSSLQGSDAKGKSIFSNEKGGMIKAYNNIISGAAGVVYANADSSYGAANAASFDAYLAAERNEQVAGSYKTLSGSTTYSNFDTDVSVDMGVTEADITAVAEVKNKVKALSGSHGGGVIPWNFTDADNSSYAIDEKLKEAVTAYKNTALISVGGKVDKTGHTEETTKSEENTTASQETSSSDEKTTAQPTQNTTASDATQATTSQQPTAVQPTTEQQSTTVSTTTAQQSTTVQQTTTAQQPTTGTAGKVIAVDFENGSTDNTFFNIKGNIAKDKGTVTYKGKTYTKCLKMETSTEISFTTQTNAKIVMVFNEDFNGKVKLDGSKCAVKNGIIEMTVNAGTHKITKGDKANLYYLAYEQDNSQQTTKDNEQATTVTQPATNEQATTVTQPATNEQATTVTEPATNEQTTTVTQSATKEDETSFSGNDSASSENSSAVQSEGESAQTSDNTVIWFYAVIAVAMALVASAYVFFDKKRKA